MHVEVVTFNCLINRRKVRIHVRLDIFSKSNMRCSANIYLFKVTNTKLEKGVFIVNLEHI